MAFKAELKISDQTYRIQSCSYGFHRAIDQHGKPQTKTQGGTINVTIESVTDTFMSDWMFNDFERKDGEITFFKTDSDAAAKTLKFTNAYLVDFQESFEAHGGMAMIANVVISAEKLEIGDGELDNEWVVG
ncbi:phage tail protein [Kriegella sp. EG-1]|nr:phage tail protein [Flavobacteriaceae bacterium EG-1]